jgi:uncharacterized RDD family membrane protein YckC
MLGTVIDGPLVEQFRRVRPRLIPAGCAIAASVAAAYLWAVIFGDGIHGGKTGSALENSRDLPNANGALIVAVGVFLASPLYYQWRTEPYGATLGKWYALTAAAGLLLFGASRLIL